MHTRNRRAESGKCHPTGPATPAKHSPWKPTWCPQSASRPERRPPAARRIRPRAANAPTGDLLLRDRNHLRGRSRQSQISQAIAEAVTECGKQRGVGRRKPTFERCDMTSLIRDALRSFPLTSLIAVARFPADDLIGAAFPLCDFLRCLPQQEVLECALVRTFCDVSQPKSTPRSVELRVARDTALVSFSSHLAKSIPRRVLLLEACVSARF